MRDISQFIFIFGLVSSPFDFIIFILFKNQPTTLQTCWFIASALTQLVLIFSLRTQGPFFKAKRPSLALFSFCILAAIIVITVPYTPFGHTFFNFIKPTATDMAWIIAVVIAYFITTETVKLFYYRNDKKVMQK